LQRKLNKRVALNAYFIPSSITPSKQKFPTGCTSIVKVLYVCCMEQFTKKQRRDIYLYAAELISDNFWSASNLWFSCGALCKAADGRERISYDLVNKFPEFLMFQPVPDDKEGLTGKDNVWWSYHDGKTSEYDTQEARRIALLLCAEICK
jgi:hypothetical protein